MLSFWEVVAAFLGGGAFATITNAVLRRKLDGVTVKEIEAKTVQIATDTARDQIELMRSVHQEMRTNYELRIEQLQEEKTAIAARAAADVATIKTEYNEVIKRVEKLEERERHMLTRAAAHEAWDQMAFQIISQQQPDFAPPPPLAYEIEGKSNVDQTKRS